ncbi:MAG: hemerythrin domain-containing protein [Planctomycetes bacterium]|nr:hemerythrin domain-containing protein [Planctomycetota bacterium]
MTNPVSILAEEHGRFRETLDRLNSAARTRDHIGARRLLLSLQEPLDLHGRKEEQLLAALRERLPSVTLDALAREEEEERAFAADAIRSLDASGEGPAPAEIEKFIAWLRRHMWREENFVFPDAERHLAESELAALGARMAKLKPFERENGTRAP